MINYNEVLLKPPIPQTNTKLTKKSNIVLNEILLLTNPSDCVKEEYPDIILKEKKCKPDYLISSNTLYLKAENLLSEFDTKYKLLIARKNLGIEDLSSDNIKGSFLSVQDISDLYNIRTSILQDGMLAFVLNLQKYYSYVASENTWKEAKFGSTGTVTGVKINGSTKNPSNGVVDLGTVITSHQDISGKQDTITDLETIRTNANIGANNFNWSVLEDILTLLVEGETLIISNASYSNNVLEIQGAKVEDETLIL